LGDYFACKCKLEEARENIKKNTRRFAKRQMTWFRSMKDIEWHEPDEKEKIFESEMRFYDHPAP
jgi:tRNA dimethylallyltransferase